MAGDMQRLNFRVLPFLRCTLNPLALPGTGIEGNPMVPACDENGILYTRQAAGFPSSSTSGGGLATSNPGAGVAASASIAGVLARKFNALSLSWSYGDTAAAAIKTLVLRDGASGVGPIIWQKNIGPLLAGTSMDGDISWAPGAGPGNAAAGSALTLEFTAAPAGTGFQAVSLVAYRSA